VKINLDKFTFYDFLGKEELCLFQYEIFKSSYVYFGSMSKDKILFKSVASVLTCFCAFLFQTSTATINSNYVIQEIVSNNFNNNFRSRTNIVKNQNYSSIHFLLCSSCFWCASLITTDTKEVYKCPKCRVEKVSSKISSIENDNELGVHYGNNNHK
jgi:hypothetical protein